MNDTTSPAALARPAAATSGRARGWPSLLLAMFVVAAAVYSFSPRPLPPFPPTQVYADRLLVSALARSGSRLVAVGEQGQILVADDPAGPWRSAVVDTPRGSTLTRATFVGEREVVAVGHDGWMLRSSDGGERWSEVAFEEGSDPLLGVAGPYDGRLFAFGAFGRLLSSDDGGQSWQTREVEAAAAADDAAMLDPFEAAGAAAELDPNADPFANFDVGAIDGGGGRHLNALLQAADGSLILAGERGLLMRSTDRGETWTDLGQIYTGSFFGLLSLPSKALIAFGMRGHVFRSEDYGRTWKPSAVPVPASLFGGTSGPQGRVALVGAGNALLVSEDDGRSFALASPSGAPTLADVLPLDARSWLIAGDNGITRVREGAAAGDRP